MIRTLQFVGESKDSVIEIPCSNKAEIEVSVGERVSPGDTLFTLHDKVIKKSYYLPTLLDLKGKDGSDYVGRVSGEYVEPGDQLAERLLSAGLTTKKVFADIEGIVSTARIREGYLDILSEADFTQVRCRVYGKVTKVQPSSNIELKVDTLPVNYVAASHLGGIKKDENGQSIGELVSIAKESGIPSPKSMAESYRGKFLYVGRVLTAELAQELLEREPLALITYSVDYREYTQIKLPVIVVGGFGGISYAPIISAAMVESVGQLMMWDHLNRQLLIINPNEKLGVEGRSLFMADPKAGERVLVRDDTQFNISGKISSRSEDQEFKSNNTVLVEKDDGGQVLTPVNTLYGVSGKL